MPFFFLLANSLFYHLFVFLLRYLSVALLNNSFINVHFNKLIG